MITIESSSNKDIIFECADTEFNRLVIHLLVALMNELDKRRSYEIGGLH
jgi:hypothetical protein